MNMIKEWPLCQVFYLESMMTICESIKSAYLEIVEKQKNPKKYNFDHNDLLDRLQLIIEQAAALSRYFWPSYNRDKLKNEIFKQRGEFLREHFGLTDNSVLKNRELRNAIEHFDENLDIFLQKPIAGEFFPNYVGEKPNQGCYTFFRAFFTDFQEFSILGKSFEITPLINQIIPIHNRIVNDLKNGGRIMNEKEI